MNSNLIEVKNLKKTFVKKTGFFLKRSVKHANAVDNVNFSIRKGETLGIIGESGCGKTTTLRMIMRLIKETDGEILFSGKNLCDLSDKETNQIRKKMQMIFQDPYDTLNPGMRILDILMEPLNAHEKNLSFKAKCDRVSEVLEEIELKPPSEYMYRYPHQLSGGQRQRIAIARAIILKPEFIAADEPTSMLDVSVRAGILNILHSLKEKMGLTMLFITHDLATASYMCDRIAVMYKGKIVEIGSTRKIIQNPSHPYTKALVSVVKDLNHFIANRHSIIQDGEVDSTLTEKGCPFAARCPHEHLTCKQVEPILKKVGSEHFVSCHLDDSAFQVSKPQENKKTVVH
ncbi:ABC transporter ATP-binding protein [Pseudalkalibacillus sp. A8]|uniref:ABC transporter ATP-binding protein n=1 Tax=Pseudalkalibacillus sp. A8 TaxID=3382641 RepID=UPI0038B60B0D